MWITSLTAFGTDPRCFAELYSTHHRYRDGICNSSSADLAVIISGSDLSVLRQLAGETLKSVDDVPDLPTSPSSRKRISQVENPDRSWQDRTLRLECRGCRQHRRVSYWWPTGQHPLRGRPSVRHHDPIRTSSSPGCDRSWRLLLHTADGGRVPLRDVADIQVITGASIIARRENSVRSRYEQIFVDGTRGASSRKRRKNLRKRSACLPAIQSPGEGSSKIWIALVSV